MLSSLVRRVAICGALFTNLASGESGPDAAAEAGPGEAGAAPEAGLSCVTSGDCGPPAPYCHATRHTCVECLGDRNCASTTGTCDVEEGVCVECESDAACSAPNRYCDLTKKACVRCLTDENCGLPGLKCTDGTCGSCGDGVCGPDEAIEGSESGGGPIVGPGGFPVPDRIVCPQDCASTCPSVNLGSALGQVVSSGNAVDLFDRMGTDVCAGQGGRDVSFKWTAPADGRFLFVGRAQDQSVVLSAYEGACDSEAKVCVENDLLVEMHEGESLTVVLDGLAPYGDYSLGVLDGDEYDAGGGICNPFTCPAPGNGALPCCTFFGTCGTQTLSGCSEGSIDPPVGGDGGIDADVKARCVQNAIQGTGPLCASAADCVCDACPKVLEDCRTTPKCAELLRCMVREGCSGVACNTPETCSSLITSAGGPSGAAFRHASGVRTCGSLNACPLSCPEPDAGTDAGAECEAGAEDTCTCGGGESGVRICKDDGSGYGRCVCISAEAGAEGGDAPAKADSSGCDCETARSSHGETPWAALGALLGAVVYRRKRRSTAPRRAA